MSNLLKKITGDVSLSLHKQHVPLPQQVLYFFTWIIVILAFTTAAFLLVSDVITTHLSHMPLSSAPLLLIGTAYLAFQLLIRAQFLDLFKALIVSCAFILWGIDQLLPSDWLATALGDIVIVLYIIDLGWMMMDRLKQQWQSQHAQSVKLVHENTAPLPVLDTSMPILISHVIVTDQQYLPKRSVASSTGSAPILKRNRLTPLACTCTSPLAPFQSAVCCCQMEEASRH
jgi:hypothetical protein